MTTLLAESPPSHLTLKLDAAEPPLKGQVWSLLSSMYPQSERRRTERFPYPKLVYLTPVASDGVTRAGDTVVVAGKHLSERGLGFYHPGPLAHRLVVASLEKAPDEWLHLLLDVSWCRFRRQRWYESGGRFLRSVPWPRSKAG
jgi:hypothetical protein